MPWALLPMLHQMKLLSRSDATGLPRDYEPRCCYSHQEPEANYAKWWHDVIRVVDVYVQSEGLEHPKPDGQSKRHQYCYTNEMLHQMLRFAATILCAESITRALNVNRTLTAYRELAQFTRVPRQIFKHSF